MISSRDALKQIVVVGGGVVGAFCAWELARSGCNVTILEQDRFGSGCSHANCGYVSPSHLLPLAQPGTIFKTAAEMLRTNSPFSIRPRMSVQSLYWFWRFMRSCNRREMLSAAEGLHALLQSSKRIYQNRVNDEAIDCQWKEQGLLFVFEHQREFEQYAETEKLIRERFGVSAESYSKERLIQLEPAIKPIVAGGWHYHGDCHLCPDQLMQSLRTKLLCIGVRIEEMTQVQQLVKDQGKLRSLETSRGQWTADQFVFATGAWTGLLERQLGCQMPIQPGKGYSVTMPCPGQMPKIPIIFEDTHVAVTPFENSFRVGSTMEFVGYDHSIPNHRIQLLRSSVDRYLRTGWIEPVKERWFGWRPMTWDSKPFICRTPKLDNAWVCAGHGMLGISTAPASAQLLRELILQQTPHIDPDHFSLSRLQ